MFLEKVENLNLKRSKTLKGLKFVEKVLKVNAMFKSSLRNFYTK